MIEVDLTSVVSYPDRGPYGDWRYRGNCSGRLIKDLIKFYKPKSVLDPCEGGRTSDATVYERKFYYSTE